MRFLVSRVLICANRATLFVPMCSRASEKEAQEVAKEDTLAFKEMTLRGKVVINGEESRLADVLTTIGIVAVEHSIHCIDQDEPIQLASADDMRKVLGGGKILQ